MAWNLPEPAQLGVADRQRLDKWLWFARLVKTRKQAVCLIEDGHVRIDSLRTYVASKPVGPGNVLTIALEGHVRVLRIVAIAARRGPARESRAILLTLDCLPKHHKGDSTSCRLLASRPGRSCGGVE